MNYLLHQKFGKIHGFVSVLLLLGIFVMIVFLLKRIVSDNWGSGKNYDHMATSIVEHCQNEQYKPRCYDEELPKLMGRLSMEEVFIVTKKVQAWDSAYPYCHTLGHALSTAETKKDPNKWQDVITRCPSGVCSNGCIHGAFQERFRAESLSADQIPTVLPQLALVCEKRGKWNPTRLERASCYHALGHLLMYITRADISKSTDLCDEIANKGDNGDFRNVCYDGVFMQLFQPLEREDLALIVGKEVNRQTHDAFCRKFTGEKNTSCISEGWPLYMTDLQEPQGLVALCSKITDQYRNRCIDGLLYVVVVQLRFDLPSIKDYCLGLPGEVKGRCFAMTASRLIETDYDNADKAIAWCKDVNPSDPDGVCFRELVKESDFIFQAGTERFTKFCESFPEPWKASCVKKSPLR